jgi:23S rRNA pseudouridine1911/1915/1917 synthase
MHEDGDGEEGDMRLVTVPDGEGGRLDKVLSSLIDDLSRARLQGLIDDGVVTLNDTPVRTASLKVKAGDVLGVTVPPPVDALPHPENIPLDIVYEDDDLLVINKPAGLVVHPGAGNWDGTLVNALLYHCKDSLSGIGGVARPGIVHRLDKETSGLMIVAKNDRAHKGLAAQLSDRTLSRRYQAFVWRVPNIIKDKVDAPIGRHPAHRLKMAVRPLKAAGAREAVTHYLREDNYGDAAALVTCDLETGRTHQIRVHMQHIGHPLLGDPLYGLPPQEQVSLLKKAGAGPEVITAVTGFPRQALHAAHIRFIHPVSGEEMGFSAPMPDDLQTLFSYLKSIT